MFYLLCFDVNENVLKDFSFPHLQLLLIYSIHRFLSHTHTHNVHINQFGIFPLRESFGFI